MRNSEKKRKKINKISIITYNVLLREQFLIVNTSFFFRKFASSWMANIIAFSIHAILASKSNKEHWPRFIIFSNSSAGGMCDK